MVQSFDIFMSREIFGPENLPYKQEKQMQQTYTGTSQDVAQFIKTPN
jgi:hypothetical protein